jgi:TonB family protein
MNFYRNKLLTLLFNAILLLTFALLIACEGKYNPRDHDNLDIPTDSLISLKVKQDNLDVEPDPGSYTYITNPEALVVPVVEADSISDSKSETKVIAENLAPIQIVVQSSQSDVKENRPPLYSVECLHAAYPVKCSSDKVAEFVRENLKFPEEAAITGYDGVEIVSLQVTEEGAIEDIQVESRKNGCRDCQTSAYSVVAAMPDQWIPALENGKPVRAKITIPIEFKTLD